MPAMHIIIKPGMWPVSDNSAVLLASMHKLYTIITLYVFIFLFFANTVINFKLKVQNKVKWEWRNSKKDH